MFSFRNRSLQKFENRNPFEWRSGGAIAWKPRAWRLEVWRLGAWILEPWDPGGLEASNLEAWSLDSELWGDARMGRSLDLEPWKLEVRSLELRFGIQRRAIFFKLRENSKTYTVTLTSIFA